MSVEEKRKKEMDVDVFHIRWRRGGGGGGGGVGPSVLKWGILVFYWGILPTEN